MKQGHTVTVLTESLSSNQLTDVEVEGIRVVRMDVGKDDFFKKFRIWWWLWQHRDLLEKADVVHCHDVFFWYLPSRFLFPKKPVYTTFHGYETKFPPAKKAIFIRKISEKLSLGNICVGEYIQKWYGTKPSYITYGGADPIETREIKAKKTNKNKLKLAFVGRFEKDIGMDLYLKALGILKSENVPFEIVFYGSGSLTSKVEKYGKVLSNSDSERLGDFDFVLASSYLSILSAFVAKKLVFAVYENELKHDYLFKTPFADWVIIEKSGEVLAKTIMYFLRHDEEVKILTEKAYGWVRSETWDKVTNIYLKLWKRS